MMKRVTQTLTAIASVAALTALLGFTSCHEVIFDTIRQEIKLEDAQITGTINSIVRYTMKATETTMTTAEDGTETTSTTDVDHEFLFCQNGNIWYRDVYDATTTKGPYTEQWSRVKQPDSNIIKLAADSEYLYALAAPTYADNEDTGDNIESGRSIYYAKLEKAADISAIEWKAIAFDGSTTLSTSAASILFCTNTPQQGNRHAYARIGEKVYELNGETIEEMTLGDADTKDHTTSPTKSTRSATVLGETVYFSSGYAMTSNETTTENATYIYYNSGDVVYYTSDGTWEKAGDPGDVIYAMAYTNDYLLLGTGSGLIHVKMNTTTYEYTEEQTTTVLDADGAETTKTETITKTKTITAIPASGSSDFDTNATSTLSSYYQVRALVAITPENSETTTAIYGSTAFSGTSGSFSNCCLWGYYPNRGKWNCE